MKFFSDLAEPMLQYCQRDTWDAASARIFEQAGFPAIATTSSGVAASLGYPDGQYISRDMLIEVVRHIMRVVACPVTVDIEAGYGDSYEYGRRDDFGT